MAIGFVPEIDIWEVCIKELPMARFTDEESADEYMRQVREEAETNLFLKSHILTLRKYPCFVVRFVKK